MPQMKIAIILGADSYVAHAKQFAQALGSDYPDIHFFILSDHGTPAISDRQFGRFFPDTPPPYEYLQKELLCTQEFIENFHAIFLGIPGTAIYRFTQWMRRLDLPQDTTRPLIATTFPGVQYTIQTYGQWTRRHADIVMFNDRRTFQNYRVAARALFHTDPDNALLFGYPFDNLERVAKKWTPVFREKTPDTKNRDHTRDPDPVRPAPTDAPRKKIVFIDQHAMPQSYEDRKYLVQKLVQYAASRPDERIIILGRSTPNEVSNHSPEENAHIEQLLNEVKKERGAQDNITLSYAPATDILPGACLCIGINSTLLIQAIWAGIPTVALKTRGTDGPFNAYRLFQKSRFALSFDDMIDGQMPRAPSARWLHDNLLISTDETREKLRLKMAALVARPRTITHHGDWMTKHPTARIKKICALWDKGMHAFIRR